jgi:rSAM/selenodomain-associated transferase 2
MPPHISVIIPALNEAAHIAACIRSIPERGRGVEALVVDGGSTDDTVAIARSLTRVIRGPRGRAAQMNAGAAHARGEVLLFLHADTRLHPQSIAAVRNAVRDRRVMGGTFTLRFDHDHPLLRFYALCSRLPARLLHYGDQGVFVRRSVFQGLGGFVSAPLMEDLDFLLRLRRAGRVVLLPHPVTTSARRFLAGGLVRQQLLNIALVAAYLCGVRPERLARWYVRAR